MQRDPFAALNSPHTAEHWNRNWLEQDKVSNGKLAPKKPDYLGSIPTADWKPKKRKDTRKRQPVLFVRNIYDLKANLRKIADEEQIPRDMLVRYMLEQGLREHQSGMRQLKPELDQCLTLYPGEKPPGKRRNKKNPNTKGVGFRNLPDALVSQIQEVANSLYVPVWQVVRRFLEQGIADYRTGKLTLPLVTVQIRRYTLYPDE